MAFKWKLRSIMADKKITLKDLAEKLGVSIRTVQTLRSDNPSIPISRLEQVCRILNCQITDLVEFIEEKPSVDINNYLTKDIISSLKEDFKVNSDLSEDKINEIVRKMIKGA